MMLPSPEIVRGWILDRYSCKDLKAMDGLPEKVLNVIAEDISISHDVTYFDDRLKIRYHLDDLIYQAVRDGTVEP